MEKKICEAICSIINKIFLDLAQQRKNQISHMLTLQVSSSLASVTVLTFSFWRVGTMLECRPYYAAPSVVNHQPQIGWVGWTQYTGKVSAQKQSKIKLYIIIRSWTLHTKVPGWIKVVSATNQVPSCPCCAQAECCPLGAGEKWHSANWYCNAHS